MQRLRCRHRLDDVGVLGAVEAVHVERPLQADERTLDARQEEQRGDQRQWKPDCQVHPGRDSWIGRGAARGLAIYLWIIRPSNLTGARPDSRARGSSLAIATGGPVWLLRQGVDDERC